MTEYSVRKHTQFFPQPSGDVRVERGDAAALAGRGRATSGHLGYDHHRRYRSNITTDTDTDSVRQRRIPSN